MTTEVANLNHVITGMHRFPCTSNFTDTKGLPQRRNMCASCPGHRVGSDPDVIVHRCHSDSRFICNSVVKDL